MPVEVDDEQLFSDKIVPHHGLSLTAGFNIHSRVFWASLGSDGADTTERLHRLKYMLDGIPQELRQWHSAQGQLATIHVNLHVTHLWLQSILLDQLERVTWSEREDISRQLLHVLLRTPHANLEANGLHLVSHFFMMFITDVEDL